MGTPEERKRVEHGVLLAAQKLGELIPAGTFAPREEPDFTLQTESGLIGVKVTELMLPPESPAHFEPVKIDKFHKKVIRMAESLYYSDSCAIPATITASLTNEKVEDQSRLAKSLAKLVRDNVGRAAHFPVLLSGRTLPEGIIRMSIWQERRGWSGGGCHGITLEQLPVQVEHTILAKEELLPQYRRNLPNIPIWLFMYTGWHVARGFEFPSEAVNLSTPFTFDKVLWYSALDNAVIELPLPPQR